MTEPLHDLEKKAVILEPPAGRDLGPIPEHLAAPAKAERVENLPDLAFERPVVIAALIWYRQTPERLQRCVRSLAKRVSGIVAVDGPYAGLSDVEQSPIDNYHAIANLAHEIALPWRIYEGQVWAGEPQKRTAAAHVALELARDVDPNGYPWVLVLDSDEWLLTDIDPDVVEAYGHGSALLHSYRGDTPEPGASGDQARMVRLIPNSESLVWGPAHFDVRDMSVPRTYSGWEKALTNEDVTAFEIAHDIGEKVIEAEYNAYNDNLRIDAEGKMMRIVDDYQRGADKIVVRMDNEQIAAGGWRVGRVVSFGAALLGQDEPGFAEVVDVSPVDERISDISMKRVDQEAAEKLIKANAAVDIEQRILQQKLLARRVAKRARQADRRARRYGR